MLQVDENAGMEPSDPHLARALALARLGKWDAPVYDGSWTEWASKVGAAIAIGR